MFALVIEDTVQDRAIVEEALENLGVSDIKTVIDGGHAIDLLTERINAGKPIPDAVVLDLNLPLVSGHEVLRFCKKTPQLKGMKVIVLSRLSSDNEIQVCYYMGATRYIQKTSDISQLERELRSVLRPDPAELDIVG
jgi:two-component system, chemotaxis family, response regulator Rcp1